MDDDDDDDDDGDGDVICILTFFLSMQHIIIKIWVIIIGFTLFDCMLSPPRPKNCLCYKYFYS